MLKKYIYSLILILNLSFIHSQVFNQKSILFIKPETHKINTESFQLPQVQKSKSRMLTFKPVKSIKITIKSGLNSSIISKVNKDTLLAGDFKDAFNDIETTDFVSIGKYDARLKIYINKKWRFLMRAQLVGFGNNFYTLGFYCKM